MNLPLDSSELQFVGHAQLHRILLTEEYSNLLFKSNNSNALKIFTYLLLKANWKDGSILKKDEVMITEETLEKDLNLTRSKIRTAIKNLSNLNLVSSEVYKFNGNSYTNKCTIYKFHNYHKKSLLIKPLKQSNEQSNEHSMNNQCTINEQSMNISSKEYKEEKENKENKTAAAGAAAPKLIKRKKSVSQSEKNSKSKTINKTEPIVEIRNYVLKLKGKVEDKILNNRIKFFEEVSKYKPISLKQIQNNQICKINSLKENYVSIIEQNKNSTLDTLIELCIVPVHFNSKIKEIVPDLKKQNFDQFQKEIKENKEKLALIVATGDIENNIPYKTYIRTNDFNGLNELYLLGKELLKQQNRLDELKTDYEWLTVELIYNS